MGLGIPVGPSAWDWEYLPKEHQGTILGHDMATLDSYVAVDARVPVGASGWARNGARRRRLSQILSPHKKEPDSP